MAKKKITQEDILKIEKAAKRNEMKEQGALDGRYRAKVIPDKKKAHKRKPKNDDHD